MASQLVVLGNLVVAHGAEGFFYLGDAVIDTNGVEIFDGASIVECTAEIPEDIDEVGYEYHAGKFVPIGIAKPWEGKMFHTIYYGTGTYAVSVTCGFKPKYAIVTAAHNVNNYLYSFVAVISGTAGIQIGTGMVGYVLTPTISADGISWTGSDVVGAMNSSGVAYDVIVFG